MSLSCKPFRPDWSRFFLDTALGEVFANLSRAHGKCINIGCGTEGRYRELLSSYEVDGVDLADPGDSNIP